MSTELVLGAEQLREVKILVVDDHEDSVALLRQVLLKAGYANVFGTTDSRETIAMCEDLTPDLLILDLNMPPPSGYDILDQLVLRPGKKNRFSILALTADITPMAKLKALSLGAKDFLAKPFEPVDLLLRTKNLLETLMVYRQLDSARQSLMIEESRSRVTGTQSEILDRLSAVIENCNAPLAARAGRVTRIAATLARSMGMSTAESSQIESAARVYDLGMLAFPNPECLEQDEKARLRGHVTFAERILGRTASGIAGAQLPLEIATFHHERWDGSGYPQGLRGQEIPVGARIVAVAAALDRLMHPQNGNSGLSMAEAVREVAREAGFAFDPNVTGMLEVALLHPVTQG